MWGLLLIILIKCVFALFSFVIIIIMFWDLRLLKLDSTSEFIYIRRKKEDFSSVCSYSFKEVMAPRKWAPKRRFSLLAFELLHKMVAWNTMKMMMIITLGLTSLLTKKTPEIPAFFCFCPQADVYFKKILKLYIWMKILIFLAKFLIIGLKRSKMVFLTYSPSLQN